MQKYAHIHTVYIALNNIFIEIFEHKFYLNMDCVTLCVRIHGYNPPKIIILERRYTHFLLTTGRGNFYTQKKRDFLIAIDLFKKLEKIH